MKYRQNLVGYGWKLAWLGWGCPDDCLGQLSLPHSELVWLILCSQPSGSGVLVLGRCPEKPHCVISSHLKEVLYRASPNTPSLPSTDVPHRLLRSSVQRCQSHLRSANRHQPTVPRVRCSTFCCRFFAFAGPKVWNSLPNSLCAIQLLVLDQTSFDELWKPTCLPVVSFCWQCVRGVFYIFTLNKCTFTYYTSAHHLWTHIHVDYKNIVVINIYLADFQTEV